MFIATVPQVKVVSNFPAWVIKKIGIPILCEADWTPASYPNCKYGLYASSTGTLAKDTTNLFWGGAASIKLLTAASNGDVTEIKTVLQYFNEVKDLLAMEFKWVQAFAYSGSYLDCGIEPRTDETIQARFRYKISVGKWQYESAQDVYSDFSAQSGGALTIDKPVVSVTAGNKVGWARVIIDPYNRKYVGFQAGGSGSNIETRDMRPDNISCWNRAGSGSGKELLFFVLISAGAAGAEAAYMTDWCITRIPDGIDPFFN